MNKRYIFVGNRLSVLESMFRLKLKIKKIYAVKNSYLSKELDKRKIKYSALVSKIDLFHELEKNNFDILISNGCPYILPISRLIKKNKKFINIHPSLLPDLRGINPINGCLLFNRPAGATCHYMDDGIDTGPIISQCKIGNVQDIELGLLYKLAFFAEKLAFEEAFKNNFIPTKKYPSILHSIYFSRKEKDLQIDFSHKPESIVRQIKAFGIVNQACRFVFNGNTYKVLDAELIRQSFLKKMFHGNYNNEILLKYESSILIGIKEQFLLLKNVAGDLTRLKEGGVLN